MTRRYELRQRAERQAQTRRRIVEAAMELHATCGPARTTIKAVAERAGVQRHTVYRHFPTEDDLFGACIGTWDERHPFPAHEPWRAIADPEERLRRALAEIYDYYATVAPAATLFARDAELVPAVRRAFAEEAVARGRLRDLLAVGWAVRGRRRRLLLAALGHAIEFATWSSLVRDQGLSAKDAVDAMCALACGASGRGCAPVRRRHPA